MKQLFLETLFLFDARAQLEHFCEMHEGQEKFLHEKFFLSFVKKYQAFEKFSDTSHFAPFLGQPGTFLSATLQNIFVFK